MNILIIQECGRHELNRNFRESLNFQRAFERLGVSCMVWGKGYANEAVPFEEIQKDRDVIFLMENYDETGWVPDLSKCAKNKIFWSIDAHCDLNSHLATCKKHQVDLVLSSTYSYIQEFQKIGFKGQWFPNAYPYDLIMPQPEKSKLHDIGFCGNLVNRREWITNIRQFFPMVFDVFVIGQDMVDAVCSYRIHWNRNIGDDVNYRTFETLGCGTFLLTNETGRLSDLFEIGKHLVTYTTLEDCVAKIQYYLKNDKEREEIAKAGHEHEIGRAHV